ncbi:MAG TPA: ATP-binding protein, partial [Burkholderiaceae bacterium]|nr:ATP-binding protein [Burkholderiaceae bacterium]
EALGRLTGGVAHDVNNLLSIVANNAVLIRRLPPDVPRDSPVDAILRAVDTGRRLTRKLLSFARHRSGQPRTIRLQDWMPTTMSMLRTSIGDNVAVRLAVESDVPCVDVDPTELELALLNLAINANDAMPGGGTLTITVRQDPAEERTVVIDVEDSGSGIDPALLPKVFDPFFTTKESSRGSGLGLSQVYGFSQQSGGTVAIRSAPGRGTIVSLRLPATDKPAAEAVRIEGTALARRRVLYVEDNAEVAAATRDVLSTFGYEVTLAFSADEAQSRIANDRFDIVLSDVAMPGETNGLQLAELLRANDPSLPVVLVSGYTAEAERALRAGFDVLQKPCLPDELAATLERVVTLARMGTSR